MTRKIFLLIAGRTSKQGCGISEGKHTAGYRTETQTLQVSQEDMAALGLSDGQRVRVSRVPPGSVPLPGEVLPGGLDRSCQVPVVVVPVETAKGGELPPGVVFIAYGDVSCRLMDSDTHGSGMPTSKGIEVLVETLPESETGESASSAASGVG